MRPSRVSVILVGVLDPCVPLLPLLLPPPSSSSSSLSCFCCSSSISSSSSSFSSFLSFFSSSSSSLRPSSLLCRRASLLPSSSSSALAPAPPRRHRPVHALALLAPLLLPALLGPRAHVPAPPTCRAPLHIEAVRPRIVVGGSRDLAAPPRNLIQARLDFGFPEARRALSGVGWREDIGGWACARDGHVSALSRAREVG
eukprot:802464-Rhodomonas_salina.1